MIDQNMTGLSASIESGQDEETVSKRPLSLSWISDEMIEDTQQLWSRRYGRNISTDEAVEILQNVKRFAEMLMERRGE